MLAGPGEFYIQFFIQHSRSVHKMLVSVNTDKHFSVWRDGFLFGTSRITPSFRITLWTLGTKTFQAR